MTLSGKAVKVEWINPHVFVHVDTRGQDGKQTVWLVELASPRFIQRLGLNRESLKEGMVLVVEGRPATSGGNRATGIFLTLPDGRRLALPDQSGFSPGGSNIVFFRDGKIVISPDGRGIVFQEKQPAGK